MGSILTIRNKLLVLSGIVTHTSFLPVPRIPVGYINTVINVFFYTGQLIFKYILCFYDKEREPN